MISDFAVFRLLLLLLLFRTLQKSRHNNVYLTIENGVLCVSRRRAVYSYATMKNSLKALFKGEHKNSSEGAIVKCRE